MLLEIIGVLTSAVRTATSYVLAPISRYHLAVDFNVRRERPPRAQAFKLEMHPPRSPDKIAAENEPTTFSFLSQQTLDSEMEAWIF